MRQKIGIFAHEIHSKYFKEAASGCYGAMGKLREISAALDEACRDSRVRDDVIRFFLSDVPKDYACLKDHQSLIK